MRVCIPCVMYVRMHGEVSYLFSPQISSRTDIQIYYIFHAVVNIVLFSNVTVIATLL